MRRWIRRILLFLAAFVLAAGGYTVYYLSRVAPVGAGYYAKVLCSGVFVSGRDPAEIVDVDLALDHPMASRLAVDVDRDERIVTVSLAGLYKSVAVFREGLGCTLAIDTTPEELRAQTAGLDLRPAATDGGMTPAPPSAEVDAARLEAAIDAAFAEPDPARPRRTRAVAVAYDGSLIAERYAPGFTATTTLQGWSMTKSLTNALVGRLVAQGRLDVHAPAAVPEWRGDGDPRAAVTLDQLLRMSSGLAFDETYVDPWADPQAMLFRSASAAAYAAAKPLAYEPDTHWSYSSGTTNIVARVVRDVVAAAGENPFAYPRRALFDPLGMASAVIEPDASGAFVGSSFSYATARDWARLGQLFLQDGVWNGERLLPEGWVAYSTTPTPASPRGRYGAHFWLNAGDDGDGANRPSPEVPADTYFMSGFEGQCVAIVPSRRVVAVRLGMTKDESAWSCSGFVADVLAAVPAEPL